jgi:hypothetical protein
MPGSHLGQDIDDPEVTLVSVSTPWLMGSRDSVVTMTSLLAGLSKHNFSSGQCFLLRNVQAVRESSSKILCAFRLYDHAVGRPTFA